LSIAKKEKLYYDECISTGWSILTGVNFDIKGELTLDK